MSESRVIRRLNNGCWKSHYYEIKGLNLISVNSQDRYWRRIFHFCYHVVFFRYTFLAKFDLLPNGEHTHDYQGMFKLYFASNFWSMTQDCFNLLI